MTLADWLDGATRGLEPQAASRIRSEYMAAYTDAASAGELQILANWGDHRTVNRDLRRVHLTQLDMAWLKATSTRSVPDATELLRKTLPWILVFTAFCIPFYSWYGTKVFSLSWPQSLAICSALWGLFCVWTVAEYRFLRPGVSWQMAEVRGTLHGTTILGAAFLAALVIPWPVPLGLPLQLLLLLLTVLVLGIMWRYSVIARKVNWAESVQLSPH